MKVSNTALTYINKLPNTAQYLTSWCKMADNVYMYSRSASSGYKSMNRANKRAQV